MSQVIGQVDVRNSVDARKIFTRCATGRRFDKAMRRFLECFSNRAVAQLAAVLRTIGVLELAVECIERSRPFVRTDDLNHRLVFCRVTDDAHRIFTALDALHVLAENLR